MIKVRQFPMIYPPRPGGAIPPSSLGGYSEKGLLAQYKFNDIRALFFLDLDGKLSVLNRKREEVKSFKVDEAFEKAFRRIKAKKKTRYVFDGGIMRNSLESSGRHPVILWDVLVAEDEYLIGSTYLERYRLLYELAGRPKSKEKESGLQLGLSVADGLWIAQNFEDGFEARFKQTVLKDELEGLMLKNPRGKLEWGTKEENNGRWQIRVRKNTGRHLF